MPHYREFHKTQPQKLAPDEWRSLRFDVDDEGREGEYYALVGQYEPRGALYDLSVGVVLEGVDPGAEVQLRASEYVRAQGEWVVARDRPIDSPVHVGGRAHFTYSWKGYLEPGRRVRMRIAQYGRSPAVILRAEASALFWPEAVREEGVPDAGALAAPPYQGYQGYGRDHGHRDPGPGYGYPDQQRQYPPQAPHQEGGVYPTR